MKTAACLITGLCLAGPACADPLLEKMRAQTGEGPIYAYEMTYSEADLVATGMVNPVQAAGERITVYSPQKADWPEGFEAELAAMDADADGDIWCADIKTNVPDKVRKLTETAETVTFAFTPLPDEDADSTERKLMKKVDAQVTLAKSDGAILGFKMNLPKPYKPMMVAKINRFNMAVECARAPDGRTYFESFSIDVAGSAMMQSFEETMSRQITKLMLPEAALATGTEGQ